MYIHTGSKVPLRVYVHRKARCYIPQDSLGKNLRSS